MPIRVRYYMTMMTDGSLTRTGRAQAGHVRSSGTSFRFYIEWRYPWLQRNIHPHERDRRAWMDKAWIVEANAREREPGSHQARLHQ